MPPKKKKVTKKVQRGNGAYDFIANNVFKGNLGKNEIHAPQYTKDGFRFGKYIGPGSDVYGRLKNGNKAVSNTDKTAKLHDIMFTLAENPDDVRAADSRMVNNLNRIQKDKSDYKFNTYMGKLPIQGKMFLENIGVMKKGSFSTMDGAKISKENRELLESEKAKLIQEGYGKKKPSVWMAHVKRVRSKHPSKSYQDCLKLASASYTK